MKYIGITSEDIKNITVTQQKDGRWYAEIGKDRIGQFGATAFEAKLNLQALLNAIREQQMKTSFTRIYDVGTM